VQRELARRLKIMCAQAGFLRKNLPRSNLLRQKSVAEPFAEANCFAKQIASRQISAKVNCFGTDFCQSKLLREAILLSIAKYNLLSIAKQIA
jgi:hypothetical protein